MSYIKVTGSGYIKLTGSFGYNTHTVTGIAANTTIDATGASWIVSNSANQFPDADTSYLEGTGTINKYAFIVYSAGENLTLRGGTVWGEVPQTSDWAYTYNNSAAVRVEFAPSVTIDDWRIDKAWDAIRIQQGSNNWLIDDVHISNNRDDAVENDEVLSGTIRDSLFDGTFAGISLGNSDHVDGSMNTVSLENVFIRLQSYLVNGEMTHGSPFKTDTAAPQTTPDIRIINSVIAIEDVSHNGMARLKLAWENVVESRGNVFLNLSDTPLPSDYPMPPEGFIILQGQEARDYWAKVEAAWLDNHDGTPYADVTPLPPISGTAPAPDPTAEPTPTPTPTPTSPTPTTNTINGTSSKDTLTGTSGVDHIFGKGSGDLIYGKGGSDVLTGGTGSDKYVFDTALDGSVDTLTDFSVKYDTIYLDNAVFTMLGSGSLSSPVRLNSAWLVDGPGATPQDANDYIIYDSSTGRLSYDADGNGPGAAITFAQLPTGLDLTNADFMII